MKTCPQCHSRDIKNLYQKKQEQESRYLELIKGSLTLIKPFRDVFKELNDIKEKLKIARAPPIICYHFPKMESELISLYKLLKYIEKTLRQKINMYFHHLALNKDSFFNIHLQPNTNINVMENILDTLDKGFCSIQDFINQKIKNINEQLSSFNKKLQFIKKITDYFEGYKQFLHLADDEKAVYAIDAKISNRHDGRDLFKASSGILFITSLDLSFVNIHGILNKKESLIFKAPVDDLVKIQETGRLFKKLYIEFPYGDYEFSLPNKAISRVVEYIILARNFNKTETYDRLAAQKLSDLDVDFSKLNSFIEEGINSFFSLKCQINSEKEGHKTSFDKPRTRSHDRNTKDGDIPNLDGHNSQKEFFDTIDSREKSMLMKKLMKANATNSFFDQVRENADQYMDYDTFNHGHRVKHKRSYSSSEAQDFTQNHISKFFNTPSANQAAKTTRNHNSHKQTNYNKNLNLSHEDMKNMKELFKMLQKRRYNIIEALENLKKDFNANKILNDDFFSILNKIQEDLDTVNNQLATLNKYL